MRWGGRGGGLGGGERYRPLLGPFHRRGEVWIFFLLAWLLLFGWFADWGCFVLGCRWVMGFLPFLFLFLSWQCVAAWRGAWIHWDF
jgi:hypothetical protein